MEVHAGSGHDAIPGLPSGMTGILLRVALRALEKSGHGEIAKIIREAPDIAGDQIGRLLLKLSNKKAAGQLITKEDESSLAAVIIDNPKEATKYLGVAVASALEGTVDAVTQTERTLSAYSAIVGIVCDLMGQAQTSFVLRGFIQGSDCLSYWHLKGSDPRFVTLPNHIYPMDLDVYLLWDYVTTAESLEIFNELILRNGRRLPLDAYKHSRHDLRGLVKEVHELTLIVERLNPDREELKAKTFFDVVDYDFPMKISYDIPFGAPDLLTMFESLFEAIEIQQRHSDGVGRLLESVQEKSKHLPRLK